MSQGVVGSTPWNSLVFLTLYFQLLGMTDLAASSLMSLFLAATALGGLVGGALGDAVARRCTGAGGGRCLLQGDRRWCSC